MSAIKHNTTKVSIRLMSGGHSFSPAQVEEMAKEGSALTAELITAKITLVPEVMFDPERIVEYLAFVGIAPAHDEVAVYSPAVDDKVAVMAMARSCYEKLVAEFGKNITFSSPLIQGHAPKQGALVDLVEDVLYVRIFNGGMLFGEAMRVENDADILFFFEQINKVYNIYNMHVRARGDKERLAKLTKHLFTNIECE